MEGARLHCRRNAVVAPASVETRAPQGALDPSPGAAFYAGKRIVVTGALGFLGESIMGMLARLDCEVVRVARRAAPARAGRARIIDITGDVRELETWSRALQGAD